MKISLKRASPRTMAAAGRLSGTIIQALKSLGAAHVTPARIEHLRRTIPQDDRAMILKEVSLAPALMHPFLHAIAADDATAAVASASRTRRATRKRRVEPWAWITRKRAMFAVPRIPHRTGGSDWSVLGALDVVDMGSVVGGISIALRMDEHSPARARMRARPVPPETYAQILK